MMPHKSGKAKSSYSATPRHPKRKKKGKAK